MPSNNTAEMPIAPAVTKRVAATPVQASNRPPTAGPAKIPMLSIAAATTFAPPSSSGVRASVGVYAASAGRKGVPVMPTSAARM
jgi:hypothetical protein